MTIVERVIGLDTNRVRRVYAETLGEAQIEAEHYVKRRPDTGPLDKWSFKTERLDLDSN